MRCAAATVAFLALFPLPASAIPVSVIAAGEPVKNAEVCIWKSGKPSNPLTRFFTSSDLTCRSADADVAIPPGEWNVFARKAPDLVSRDVALVTDGMRPKQLVLELVPGVTADLRGLRLMETEHAFAYLEATHSAIPLDGRTPLPVATASTPVVTANGKIVRIGQTIRVERGTSVSLMPDPPSANRSHIVVPVRYESVPKGKAAAPELAVPNVRIALVPLRGSVQLAFVRNVPAGPVAIEVHGERWKTATARVEPKGAVFVIDDPITTAATSRVAVHWWTPADIHSLVHRPEACAEKDPSEREPELGTSFTAALLRCLDRQPGTGCVAVAEQTLPEERRDGVIEFAGVAAGHYLLRFTVPGLPQVSKRIEVPEDESFRTDAELRYASFFGKITRGGKPVHARFFDTVSNAQTGEYVAVLDSMPGGMPTSIVACDGSWKYRAVFDPGPAENAAFDIEVPRNRVNVTVVDAASGTGIENATVSLAAIMPGESRSAHFAGRAGRTDASGRLVIEPVLDNRMLVVCASDESHDSKCADPFTMKDIPEKLVMLSLPRIVKRQGRIVNAGAITFGMLMWFSREGRMTEMVREFASDGSFIYKKPHAEGEAVVLTTASTPLYAFLQPRLGDDEVFLIEIPAARRRTFNVTLSPDSTEKVAFVALAVGNVLVPINALGRHQMMGRFQNSLRPGRTTTVQDVAETGPITVILVPASLLEQFPRESEIQLPLVTQIGSLPHQLLGERDAVTFP